MCSDVSLYMLDLGTTRVKLDVLKMVWQGPLSCTSIYTSMVLDSDVGESRDIIFELSNCKPG